MIIVFARAPVPGRAKTRLIPRLGAWGAARLHLRLLRQALRTAAAANCGPVELHGTTAHSHFRTLKGFRLQRGKDLGERMHRAVSASLRRHERVILIGSDCPALQPRDLRRADAWLKGACDAVLAPAEDGGYGLIALRKVSSLLFEAMRWGGAEVYEETRRRLERLGWRWRALRTVWDVDRPEDLERLRALRFPSAARRAARR
ncbi:MAG: TIGR04282 family arsenosugar biosynthesis glycosyltransferase [Betaproteobacteria bacterium]